MRVEIENMLTQIYDSLATVDRAIESNRTEIIWRMNPIIQSMYEALNQGVELARMDDAEIEWDDWAALIWARHELADYCHKAAVKLGGVAYD